MSVVDRIQELADKIPGYQGYRARENRRDSDKELREAVSAAFSSQVTRIQRVQEELLSRGDLENLEALDRVISRLQHLADRIRGASYGFTGLFDANRVDEAVLDRLYTLDLEIANGVEKLGDAIAHLGLKGDTPTKIGALRDRLEMLHETVTQREGFIESGWSADADDPAPTPVEEPIAEHPIDGEGTQPTDRGPMAIDEPGPESPIDGESG